MIGWMATSKAGHDKDKVFVIVGEDDTHVYLSDGDLKKLETPKKKSKKHIQPIKNITDDKLMHKLQKNEKVINEEIKRAIKDYHRQSV